MKKEKIDHPSHYGGDDNTYETIKVIESLKTPEHVKNKTGYAFCVGNAIKYSMRAGIKDAETHEEDLKKAIWYLERAITNT